MLRNATDIEQCSIGATDGDIGKVHDLYFDDQRWVIRYLVVNSGAWLLNRAVLISPISLIESTVWHADLLPASISKDQVKNSPAIDTDKPVSRQYEQSYYSYYGYPYYWGGMGLWGSGGYPGMMMPGLAHDPSALANERAHRAHDDPHLRSCREVKGYHLQATDGDIGHVAGYLIDDKSWAIRFLIVNTSNWWIGHQVLIACEWIDSVDWEDHKVATSLSRAAVKASPPYDSALLLDFAGEQSIYRHYGRPAYDHELAHTKVA
jgi:uncharacterized protein YrrD